MHRTTHALLLSGGTGSRLNASVPKQYISTDGRMMISRTIEALKGAALVDDLWIVADKAWREAIERESGDKAFLKGFSDPGTTRQLSILNGLRAMGESCRDDDIVLIQDAARPFTSAGASTMNR